MGKQTTLEFLLPELSTNRPAPPADCLCNGMCTIDPCAKRASVACVTAVHRGARRLSRVGAEGAARSALKATSEVGTGGPATRVIESDVLPTSPGHGDACGALRGL